MTDKGKKYLSDILIAAKLIEDFVVDIPDFTFYENDLKTQSAVERKLAIIVEALNQFKKAEPNIVFKQGQQIISFRNRLVHAYDSIDNAIVWAILKRHLPELKQSIVNLSEGY